MPNRLATSTSPYLQQHADNPVDWYEWGEDAFAEARRRDVPILLSIGYSACHWCHVMAHESFEDPDVAAVMNERFVNVKVDREERPDVDAVYMAATQAMTGRGGWPMTVFTTPDGEPFWCGTYFPPRPVGEMPSFRQVLDGIAGAWQEGRDDVHHNAQALRDAVGRTWARDPAPALGDAVGAALDALRPTADLVRGGFGGAPKFPPSMVLEWLLRHHARTGRGLDLATPTLVAMARGGMYDQLGGGFARYSVDADWVVPHFEKMLDDNALLLRVYAHWARATGEPLARRVTRETAQFLLAQMRTPEGGFASALDADSADPADPDGATHEGTFYVWTPAQLREVLGDDDGAWAAALLHVTEAGTFEHGASVLQLRHEPDDPQRWADVRARLLAARAERPRPARDDKVVAAWNGLAIAALADAGVLLEEDAWVQAAVGAAELLVGVHLRDGRLLRTSRDGVAGSAPGVLEDYAGLAEGLLALYQATGDPRWYRVAEGLLEEVLTSFGEPGHLYDTADHSTDPVIARLRRPRDVADGPSPSGPAAAAGALLTYAALSGSTRHRQAAEQALDEPLAVGTRVPRAAGWALAVAEAMLDGPREVALVGDDGTLRRVAAASSAPGLVVAADGVGGDVPLLRDRPARGGPTAYVCRGFVCAQPTTDPVELARQLDARTTP